MLQRMHQSHSSVIWKAELTKAVEVRAAIAWVLLWWWKCVTHEFKKCKGRLGVNSKLSGAFILKDIFHYELIFCAAAGVFPSSDLRNALVFSRSGHGLRRAPFYCSAHKSQRTASTSPVETQSADTLLDGPVDRVHPGAGIHLLPAVCIGHKTQSGSVPLSLPENNGVKGQPGSVTHWLAESPLGSACSLETRGHNQKWGRKKVRGDLPDYGDTVRRRNITSLLVLGYSCKCCGTETAWGECFTVQKKKRKLKKKNTRWLDCNETRWFVCSVWLAVPWKLQRSSTAGRPPIPSTGKRVSFTS